MEDMLCAMALKSANGRQIQHTQAGLLVFCERALKSVGERTPHTGGRFRCGVSIKLMDLHRFPLSGS